MINPERFGGFTYIPRQLQLRIALIFLFNLNFALYKVSAHWVGLCGIQIATWADRRSPSNIKSDTFSQSQRSKKYLKSNGCEEKSQVLQWGWSPCSNPLNRYLICLLSESLRELRTGFYSP